MHVYISLYILRGGVNDYIYLKKKFSLKFNFVLANSADPNEMPHIVAFHLGLHCLPKYPFTWIQTPKS